MKLAIAVPNEYITLVFKELKFIWPANVESETWMSDLVNKRIKGGEVIRGVILYVRTNGSGGFGWNKLTDKTIQDDYDGGFEIMDLREYI